MRAKFRSQVRELAFAAAPAMILVLAAFWLTAQFITPAPPKTIAIAASRQGSPYYEAAQRYRRVLADNGVALEVVQTSGTIENISLLSNASAPVAAGFVQGGIASGKNLPQVASIGRVFYEPVWIFSQGPEPIERLPQLIGKRVLIGPKGGATAALAERLLAASGVTASTATLINMELPDYVATLEQGAADAGFLVLAAEAPTVRRLLASDRVRLVHVAQADAYAQRFPFLSKLVLQQGVVDFARNIPAVDTAMLTTTTALLVRRDVHPALINLLTQAVISVHGQPMLNANGEASVFQRAGAFPITEDQEFPLSPDALRVYKSGPPLLQRYFPFWLATLADRLFVLLLPVIGILLPVLRFAPTLYTWRVRRRIVYWYRELKRVEATADRSKPERAMHEIDRIEDAVNLLPVPLGYANQLYDLRQHIDVVRRRLAEPRANFA